ncbi:kinase-like protein [Rhizophagus irregularis]|uniref:Kinase-like protein n=1 Tax=Rhizophagus irregularis TaxID=588596 RepID=A0A2I1H1Q7_9GLOM|nr:kinase-like protein [Rhizophagus irregularis]
MNQNTNPLRINNNHSYQQYEALLGVFNANRLLVFPPPIINPNIMIGLLNNNTNQRINGCRLLRYFVSLQGQNVSSNIIGLVTSYLWKNANPNEKDDYVNLAAQLIKTYKIIGTCPRASGLENLVHIYGATRDYENGDYGIVMEYLNSGNLEKYLENNWESITWREKLGILKDAAHGLLKLHDAGLIHGDLHTRNVMISTNLYDHPTGYLGDFGLCRTDESNESNSRIQKNVIPYMAPELLLGEGYTKKADIYSFGLIMYQVATNTRPERYRHYKHRLANDILNGRRPGFNRDLMPHCYESLMRNCWSNGKRNRPKAETLYARFCEWEENYYKRNSPFKNFRLQRVEPSGNGNGYF